MGLRADCRCVSEREAPNHTVVSHSIGRNRPGRPEMTDTTRAEAARRLVDRFAHAESRHEVLAELERLGPSALMAVRAGLGHGSWQVRRWCAIFLDHHGDSESRVLLIPLLRDPRKEVRLWAVHSLSCERCKPNERTLDVVPLLIERIEDDESIRVRRMATAMLAYGSPDPRAVPVFRALLEHESDRKLRLHAEIGLMRCRESGIASAR